MMTRYLCSPLMFLVILISPCLLGCGGGDASVTDAQDLHAPLKQEPKDPGAGLHPENP